MRNENWNKWRSLETYFGHSWSHIFYHWKVRKIMLGETIHQVLHNMPAGHRKVAELGCNTGTIIFELADICAHMSHVEWVGLDLNVRQTQEALDRNEFRVKERQKQSVHFVAGNLFQLPFPDASIDLLVSSEVVEHLPDPNPAIREMARVLKPGGYALVTTPNPHSAPTRVGYVIDHLTGGALKRLFWKGHDPVSAPPLRAEVGYGHVSVHPFSVWKNWLCQAGLTMVRKVRGPAVFGGPFFDRHPFLMGCMVAADPILDCLPLRFLLSENLGLLCQKTGAVPIHR